MRPILEVNERINEKLRERKELRGVVEQLNSQCLEYLAVMGMYGLRLFLSLIEHSKEESSDKRGGHINSLEGFWGYLKRNLASKGGIQRERLPLYLAEYVWRFNHRNYTIEEQTKKLLNLLYMNI